MESTIKFRMHAFSDAAGRFDPNSVREGNEDNFYIDDNLGDNSPHNCESDIVKNLDEHGLIMVVADGMGGMNAGEVASEIAVATVKDYFSPDSFGMLNAATHEERSAYLEKTIIEADRRIKADTALYSQHKGMGSTIVLAWIVGNELTLSWCGDSRAYRFNKAYGIQLISEDHSYVQELVNKGVLTYDQTFGHPQGNIVTRCLGDESGIPVPESRLFTLYDNDIILLCSDGLSGVLRDRRTPDGEGGFYPGENIEDTIKYNSESMVKCREALFDAARKADWNDNVTAILCQIVDGAGKSPDFPSPRTESGSHLHGRFVKLFIVAVLLVITVVFFFRFFNPMVGNSVSADSSKTDSIKTGRHHHNDNPKEGTIDIHQFPSVGNVVIMRDGNKETSDNTEQKK